MSPPTGAGAARATVVVAHDDAAVRGDLAHRLGAAGHRVVPVRTGTKALEVAPGADLVVAPLELPRIGGAELVTRLRALPGGGPAALLIVAAGEADPAALVTAGADDWLTPPFPDEDLLPRVAVALRTAAARRAAHAAAEQARRDRDRLAGVVGAMLDGLLVIAPDGEITFASDRLCAMTGFARDDVVGRRPPYPFWPPERMERIAEALVRRLPAGEGEFDVDFRRSDGTDLPVIVGVSQEPGSAAGAFVVTVKDVSDRRRQEVEIARLTRAYEGILNSAGEGIYGVDRRGWVTFANPAASAMLGWSVEELQGQSMHVFGSHTRPDGSPFPVEEWLMSAAIEEGATWRSDDEEFWRKDGTSFPVEYTSTPIREDGEIVGAVCCFSDITERRGAEEEIRRQRDHAAALAAELEDQNGRLQHQGDTLGRLLSELGAEKGRVEIVYAFSQRLAQETGLAALGAEALRGFQNAVGASAAALYVAGERGDALTLAAARGAVHGDLPERIPVAGLASRALASGEPCALSPPEEPVVSAGAGWSAGELAVPLVHGGRPMAVAFLMWPEGVGPEASQLSALDHLTAPAAGAIANVLSYEAAEQQAGITRAVLDATPDGICLIDRSGRIVLSNPAFSALHAGLAADAGVAMPSLARGFAARTTDAVAYCDRLEEILDNPVLEAVDAFELTDPGRSIVRYTAPVRDANGALVGRIFVHRDVTAERQAERMKDEFVALASHELRSPLTSIRGYVDILLDGEAGDLGEEQEEFLAVVRRNTRRLERLVDDLIVESQAGAGKLRLEHGDADLALIVREAAEAAHPVADAKGVRLDVAAGGPLAAWCDPGRMRQVVDNLISNAVKFTPAGGSVRVTASASAGGAVVEVSDTGMGIAPDELPRLFERFYRTSGASQAHVPGTGLGLSICKAIVEGHGGEITVRSAEGMGTTFRVALPRVRAASAA